MPAQTIPTAEQQVLSDVEHSINIALLVLDPEKHPHKRKALLRARGDLREANGEPRS